MTAVHSHTIAIVGGSTGGTAAYLLACELGADAILICETTRLGGQLTTQGVPALDEHPYIETFGGTARYHRLRQSIRSLVQAEYGAPAIMKESVLGADLPLNPGNGWVSRLCFLPAIAERALAQMVSRSARPARALYGWQAEAVRLGADGIEALIIRHADGTRAEVRARYYLDATDAGDLIALAGLPFVTGAEARDDTGEPHAEDCARPGEVQGFTYGFAVEFCPGEDHTIPKPPGYEAFRDSQPYTLAPPGRDGQPVVYRMFENAGDNLPFWTYRRLHDGALLGGNDIALINWISNDYHGGDILSASPADRVRYLDEAKRLSLGFLYWLQTECPRDDGGYGYPELKLRPDVMGTADGLSELPYLRESRRIVPLTRIVEQDIAQAFNDGARARPRRDSVGIGWYAMDLHPCVGNPRASLYEPTRPFQLPLGALIPRQACNLIAACKNIGTTHITNGAYRLHPTEWAIGEAALLLALTCTQSGWHPHELIAEPMRVWRLQNRLARAGVPLAWAVDVGLEQMHFPATQAILAWDVLTPGGERWHTLAIEPEQALSAGVDVERVRQLADALELSSQLVHPELSWAELCLLFDESLRKVDQEW